MVQNDDSPTRVHPSVANKRTAEENGATRVQPQQAAVNKTRVKGRASNSGSTRIAPSQGSVGQPPSAAQMLSGDDGSTRLARASARRLSHAQVLKPGSMIRNRFRLEKEIGRGGMGVVYAARDLRKEEVGDQDSRMAIKLLSDDFKHYPESLRMLQQETRKAQQLAHPNVVTVYDFDRDGETVYMTMEYLSGHPLDDYLDEHKYDPPDVSEALPIITDIVNGLEYAHQQGVVHSDLKPGNIFLTDTGVAKILDFGIARAVMQGESIGKEQTSAYSGEDSVADAENLDTDALIALTPGYASLEMFEGAPPDPRDDLFALACITYKLLSGKHPFGNMAANEVYERGLAPARIDGLNDRQWKVLAEGLALEKEKRIGSAKAFLEGFLPKRKEPWKYVAAAVAVIAIISTAYYQFRDPPEAVLTEAQQLVVKDELEVASVHFDIGNLATAINTYKMILALPPYDKKPPGGDFIQQPFNRKAMSDLNQIADILEEKAVSAIDDGRLVDAEEAITSGVSIPYAKKRFEALKKKLAKLQ